MLKGLLSFWLVVKLDHTYYKNKKKGKARLSFTKDPIPKDKESPKYHMMIDLLKESNITPEEYNNSLDSESETSSIRTDANHSTTIEITSSTIDVNLSTIDSLSTTSNQELTKIFFSHCCSL